MSDERPPFADPRIAAYLRKQREDWANAMPPPGWDPDRLQRAIGANEVLQALERLGEAPVEFPLININDEEG